MNDVGMVRMYHHPIVENLLYHLGERMNAVAVVLRGHRPSL